MAFWDFTKGFRVGRRPKASQRETTAFPALLNVGVRPNQKVIWKPTPRNLRYFSRTPYARRAINAIKNPIAELQWEVVAAPGVTESPELKRQIEVATECLSQPNSEDNFRALFEQVMEDILVGAGSIETQPSGDPMRPLWMWPVDGLSIQLYPGWNGDRSEVRYAQSVGYGSYAGGGPVVQLRDDELIYIRPNPSTSTPFGLGPLEVAFNSISRQLGVAEFAGNVTTNAKPSTILDLGDGADESAVSKFRAFWTNMIEGQGLMPIVATKNGKVLRLYPEGDEGLFLKFQEFLKSEVAICFDLSPQNLGVERDINRSTSEVAEDRDWDHAIKPRANEFAGVMTRQVLHKRLGFYQLRFRFIGLDREDEKNLAEVFALEWKSGAVTPNEYRETRGRPPLDQVWADLTGIDVQIAIEAARGAKIAFDPQLPDAKNSPAPAGASEGD